jgi:hypothetical protein
MFTRIKRAIKFALFPPYLPPPHFIILNGIALPNPDRAEYDRRQKKEVR